MRTAHPPLAAISSAKLKTGVFVCCARERMRWCISSDCAAEPPALVATLCLSISSPTCQIPWSVLTAQCIGCSVGPSLKGQSSAATLPGELMAMATAAGRKVFSAGMKAASSHLSTCAATAGWTTIWQLLDRGVLHAGAECACRTFSRLIVLRACGPRAPWADVMTPAAVTPYQACSLNELKITVPLYVCRQSLLGVSSHRKMLCATTKLA